MNKKLITFASAAALAVALPAAAFAHGLGSDLHLGLNSNSNVQAFFHRGEDRGDHKEKAASGSVTAVSSTGFTLKANNGSTYTVNTAEAQIIMQAFGNKISLADIHVGDSIRVNGSLNSSDASQIDAKVVIVSPANTHPASGRGTVSAVSGNSLTLKLNNDGIMSTATVNTSANTSIVGQNGATTTSSSIQVGSKITVKGLWDEINNVLNAIKIRILK